MWVYKSHKSLRSVFIHVTLNVPPFSDLGLYNRVVGEDAEMFGREQSCHAFMH